MARARTADPEPQAPTGFLASAVRLPTPSRNQAGRSESWQSDAWNYHDTVGELRQVANWTGNVMSRARLTAAHLEGRMLVPLANGPAAEAMEAFYGGPQGQSEMLQQLGVHLTVAGEAYIINRADGDLWNVIASGKVTQQSGGKITADFGTGNGRTPLTGSDLVIRIWTPHPRDPTRPDSPVRSTLNTLAQVVSYDAHITAQIRSRLAGAGILFLSNEVQFPVPPGMDPAASQAQIFMALLGESMMTPIADPADPSAIVPIVAMVPTESLGKNEHLKFWTELDKSVIEMRDAGIKRLALGWDVPPEVLLGISDSNHWNAWLSEESAVKAHLEPRLSVVAYAGTTAYLRPAIEGLVPDPENYFMIADTSAIRLRPNRSTEAIELYDRGELSGMALRRETGFQPEDTPPAEEFVRWLLRKIATGSTSPEQTQAALAMLGADLGMGLAPADQNRPPPDDMRTDTGPDLPQREIPTRSDAEARISRTQRAIDRGGPGLAAACDVLVYRALERAGNRLRNAHPRTDTTAMQATDVYRSLTGDPDKLLAGAWDCAYDVLQPYTDDAPTVISTLDFYVRGLLGSQRTHSAVVLGTLLAACPETIALEPA
jgi:hypothetical protein